MNSFPYPDIVKQNFFWSVSWGVSHLDGAHRCQTSWRGTGNQLIVAWRCSLCLGDDGTTPSAHPLYQCQSHTDINFSQLSRVPHPLDLSCCVLLSLSWDDHTSCLGQGFDVRLSVHFIGLLLSQHIYTYARRYNLNVNNFPSADCIVLLYNTADMYNHVNFEASPEPLRYFHFFNSLGFADWIRPWMNWHNPFLAQVHPHRCLLACGIEWFFSFACF